MLIVNPSVLVQVRPSAPFLIVARRRARSLELPCEGGQLEMFGYAGRSRWVSPHIPSASFRPPFTSRVLVHGLDSKSRAAGCESLAVCIVRLLRQLGRRVAIEPLGDAQLFSTANFSTCGRAAKARALGAWIRGCKSCHVDDRRSLAGRTLTPFSLLVRTRAVDEGYRIWLERRRFESDRLSVFLTPAARRFPARNSTAESSPDKRVVGGASPPGRTVVEAKANAARGRDPRLSW